MPDGRSFPVTGGVRNRLYEGFPWLYLQTDAGAEFIPAPDWYYNFEYTEERERGYDYLEDLLTTGYFETEITKGKPVVFSCSLEEVSSPAMLDEMFEAEAARRSRKDDFLSCLRHSARQFIVRNAGGTDIVAGYPWFRTLGPRHLHRPAGRHAFAGRHSRLHGGARHTHRTVAGGAFPEHGHRLQFGGRSAVVLLGTPAARRPEPPPGRSGSVTATT